MNTNFLDSVTNFLKKRTFELLGLILVLSSVALVIAFTTYSPEDPSFIYGDKNFEIQNFFGIYGSSIADFLLQSFGLASFLLIFNFLFWGLNLIIKKELKRIILKLFLVISYLVLGTVFIYLSFNNSFWLIDNGNSGFVGEITYNFLYSWVPWIDSTYSIYLLLFFTIIFFTLSADLNLRRLFFSVISIFRKKKNEEDHLNFRITKIEEDKEMYQKPQQSLLFDNDTNIKEEPTVSRNKYKLPDINYLEKKLSKLSSSDIERNQPDSEFMEKILLDFGINGKIKTINNGPVVSLYEFEPAPGIKVSKIINLSEDLARNTSSTSTRVSVIPGKNNVGIEIPNEERECYS